MRLYGYWRSSASWRVRIALAYKGIDYDYAPVHLLEGGGAQHGGAHRARNPMRQVPVLEVEEGGGVHRIAQSMAILEYLEETHPAPPMLPREPLRRALVRQLAETCNSGIQPLHNLAVLQHLKELGVDEKAWSRHWVGRGLEALEALLAKSAGRFAVGDEVTFADACLAPQLYAARRFADVPAGLPTLLRLEAAYAEHPAFRKAHADAQPDAAR